jgi:uncharacterized membrane protein YbhN (UPF0104 family)
MEPGNSQQGDPVTSQAASTDEPAAQSNRSRPTVLSRIYQILKTLVTLGMVYWLLRMVDWPSLLPLLKPELFTWLIGSFAVFVLSELVIAWRWSKLLSVAGVEVSLANVTRYVFISMFTSNFLPGTISGDVVKMVGLSRQKKDQQPAVIASVIVDRLYNLAGMILMTPVAISLNWQIVPGIFREVDQTIIHASVFPLTGVWHTIRRKLAEFWQASQSFTRSPGMVARFLAYSMLSSQLSFFSFYLVCLGLGIQLTYPQMMLVCMLSYFSGLLPISINGLGVQEGVFSYVLVHMGAALPAAVAAAFLTRLVFLFVSLIGGVWLGMEKKESSGKQKTP